MKNLAVTSTNINQRSTIMEWLSIQLIMSSFSFIFVTESDALSYYVIPNEKSDGWSTFFTLQKYASQPDEYFTDHTIFYFEFGSHQLNSSLYLVNMSNLTFQGLPNSELVNVLLGSFVNITWEDCSNIEILFINFILQNHYTFSIVFEHSQVVHLFNISVTGNKTFTGCSAVMS